MSALGVRRPARSPVTRPGYGKGRKPGNAGRTWPVEPLTDKEVGLLISGCSRRSDIGVRNRAMIAVLYRAGLRNAEVRALYPKDVDVEGGRLRILHGKGDKQRLAAFDPKTGQFVALWLARRDALGLDGRFPLFCSLHGTALYGAYLRELLHRLARQAGIQKRVHPHGLRHTHAFELANERVALLEIQQQLGHSSPAITAAYIDHLNPTAIVDTMRARDW